MSGTPGEPGDLHRRLDGEVFAGFLLALEQLASPQAVDVSEGAAVLRQLVELLASPAATVSKKVRQS
jgi:hypothetical protein